MGDWGRRIAAIEVRHEDHQNVDPLEVQDIDVGVDSGQCGIYDFDYFAENRKDKNGEDEWYDRVCDITDEYVKNPNYVPFEKSEFYKDDYKLIHYAIENYIPINGFSGEEILDYCRAHRKYLKTNCSIEDRLELSANTLDNKCFVSSSGDGDGSYTCFVGRDCNGNIVSIKIDYYYRYDEEDEE